MADIRARRVAVCCLNAIIAGLLSYTDQFCFYSIAGASIVMSECSLNLSRGTHADSLS